MTLGEFKSLLRDAIKRGNSFDSQLNGFARRAARWVEQNHTLHYMRRRFTLLSVAGENTIVMPTNVPVKSIEYLRFDATDGTRYEMTKGDLSDPSTSWVTPDRYAAWPQYTTVPTHFYLDGNYALIFNHAFPEALTGQGIMARFSDFPTAENQTHWLLQYAEGLMLRQSMLEFMTDVRDDRGFQATMMKRQEDIQALMNADHEARWTGQSISWGA